MSATEAQQPGRHWDAIIIGAGMGGCMVARQLAEAGFRVLLVERGKRDVAKSLPVSDGAASTLDKGWWPTPNSFEINGQVQSRDMTYGAGVGGSTLQYAAALERFEPYDLEPLPEVPHPTGGWPYTYEELAPYYVKAEKLLHVVGGPDPLSGQPADHLPSPPPLGPLDTELMRSFSQSGLHPYRLHVGIRYRPGCDECLSKLCPNDCRADARTVLAESPAQPTILDCTEVRSLEAGPHSVFGVRLNQHDQQFIVQGRVVVLAAGAVHTPKLLLRSMSKDWPDGLANRSGMVGRNLMFHAVQRFVMWSTRRLPSTGPRKSISFRDFYLYQGERLGSVQSSGFEAGYGDLLMHFYSVFDRSRLRKLRLLRPFLRIPAMLAIKIFGRGTIFNCCLEDFPYPDNRVVLDPEQDDGIRMQYTVREELKYRNQRFHEMLKKHLDPRRTIFSAPVVDLNFSHACGTCVMGDDPTKSVVDRNGKAHGIDNLYIADASFMPTSAAINPSLTVAANALRVADAIKAAFAKSILESPFEQTAG